MRTNIEIDDALLAEAMKAGPYQTKKEAVEAGLKLLARQVAYREIMKWRGKLKWEGDESIDWTQPQITPEAPHVAEPTRSYGRPGPAASGAPIARGAKSPSKTTHTGKRRAGR